MPAKPRPDETRAAEIVHRYGGVAGLVYADRPHGVDFLGHRDAARVALEVTRFTSPDRGRDPAVGESVPLQTRHSWLVFLADGPHARAAARDLLEPALQALERHRIREYHASQTGWWMVGVPTLQEACATLTAARVVAAQVVEASPPQLFLAVGAEAPGADPHQALQMLEDYLAAEAHHLAKTAAAPAQERHLFVWVDGATPAACAGVFVGSSAPRLPARPPAIPQPITHLWVMHEQTRRGWHWQRPGEAVRTGGPDGWSALGPHR